MRIALLSHAYPPETGGDGIGTYTWQHAHALAQLGHDVHVFAGAAAAARRHQQDGAVAVTRLHKNGVLDRLLPDAPALRLDRLRQRLANASDGLTALRHELQRQRFDVVEVPECGGEGALLGHCLELPVVVRLQAQAHGTDGGDRALAALIDRLTLTGSRALSAPSLWLQQQLQRRWSLYRPIAVVPHGIDVDAFDAIAAADLHADCGIAADKVAVFVDGTADPAACMRLLLLLVPMLLTRRRDVAVVAAGADPDGIVERQLRPLLRLQDRDADFHHLGPLPAARRRACRKGAGIVLLLDGYEAEPQMLLEAMAAGTAIVAADRGGSAEILRHEVDGLLVAAGNAEALARGLERLLRSAARRRDFGGAARQRVEGRYRSTVTAQRAVEFYTWALGLGGVTTVTAAATMPLTPADWFEAWWLRGNEPGAAPALGPGFAALSLPQLSFVQSVLARVYWQGRGRWDSAEAGFLAQLAACFRDRADAARQRGRDHDAAALVLPPIEHPLFDDDAAAGAIADELWRLGDTDAVGDWLQRLADSDGLAARAKDRLVLRRLCVEAARRRPSAATFALLRSIYRDGAGHAPLIAADRAFIAGGGKGAEFADVVRHFGLHAPLQRPAVFKPSRRRPPASASTAEITVLIPSYRHQDYIEAAIASVLQQTHRQLRVLVVDDRSPDDTVAVARAVDDPRLEVRENPRNLGLGGSIVAALPSIETPYVALLNSDDVFHPQRLQRCLEVLEREAGIAVVASGLALMDKHGRRLTPETSCAVDIGLPAHEWVRWYDRVMHEVAPQDLGSFAALLRHNHLATSSNIVCRTAFLRQHESAITRLKYCLDWSLFLHAALAGALACLPEPLMGYRLHDSNTVWFADDARPGYVHEVNAVVAEALHTLADLRLQAGASPRAVVEEIAGLLHQHVRAHGESDGFTLFLAELTRELPSEPATVGAAELARLTQKALELHRGAGAVGDARAAIDRHAAETFTARSRELEPEVQRLTGELAAAAARAEDAWALRQRLDQELQQTAQATAELQAERAALQALQQQLQHSQAEVERLQRQQAALEHQLEQARQQHAAELQQRAEELQQERRQVAELQQAVAQLQDQLQRTTAELEHARAALAAAQLQLTDQQLQHRAEIDVLEARSIGQELQRREQRQLLLQSHEYRLGRLLLQKLHLGGPFKSALRLGVHARVRGGRLLARLRRLLPGGEARALLVCSDRFPAATTDLLAAHCQALREQGIDARIVSWGTGSPRLLRPQLQATLQRRAVLRLDGALQQRDRAWCERRRSAEFADVAAACTHDGDADRVPGLARTAKALGAGYLHGIGLGHAGFDAGFAARLLHIPFGLSISATDVADFEHGAAAELIAKAAVLAVDTEATAAALRSCAGTALPAICVLPPPVYAAPPAPASDPLLFACFGPFADATSLPLLADACRLASAGGADVRIEISGTEDASWTTLQAVERLRRRASLLDVARRFVFTDTDPQLLDRAGAVIELAGAAPGAVRGLPAAAVEAMARARPVVGFAGGLARSLTNGDNAVLVPRGSAADLGAALRRLAEDPALGRRLGAAARATYERELTPAIAAVAFGARVRQLLHPTPSSPPTP